VIKLLKDRLPPAVVFTHQPVRIFGSARLSSATVHRKLPSSIGMSLCSV